MTTMIIIKNKQRVITKYNHSQVYRSLNLQVHGASKKISHLWRMNDHYSLKHYSPLLKPVLSDLKNNILILYLFKAHCITDKPEQRSRYTGQATGSMTDELCFDSRQRSPK
jgi:hypothetical protein